MHPHPLKVCIGIITAFLLASALVSCGNSAPSGYLGMSPTSVWFIAWINSNNQLTGTVQVAYLDSSQNLKSISIPLSGVISGSSVTLTFSIWGFPTNTYVGTLNNNRLTLSMPQPDGTLQASTFDPATTDDYNNAVQSLQATATSKQATATEQQVEASNAQATAQVVAATATAIADEQPRLAYDLNNIGSAINSLTADGAFSSLLNGYSHDIGSMQSDYHTEQSDASGGCTNYGQVGADLGQVGADLGQVGADQGQIGADQGQLQAQISSVQNDIANVQDFVQKIQQHWNDLGQQPFSGVSASDVNNALKSGNNAINRAKANIQSAQSQASGFDAQANQIEQQAQALYNGMHC